MTRKRTVVDRYASLAPGELHQATTKFDAELVASQSRALTKEEATWWERVRRRPGRPRKGSGAKVISVSVEQSLLAQSDALAKNLGISRALLIERGLKAVLAAEGRL